MDADLLEPSNINPDFGVFGALSTSRCSSTTSEPRAAEEPELIHRVRVWGCSEGMGTVTLTYRGLVLDSHKITVRPVTQDSPGVVTLSPSSPDVGTTVRTVLVDADGSITNKSWRWERSSNGGSYAGISGVTGSSYMVKTTDRGRWLRVTVSYDDGHGPDKSATSNGVRIPSVADRPGTVTLTPASPVVGTATTATLSDADGNVRNESWSWWRSSDGSTSWSVVSSGGSSYTPVSADAGKWLQARVSYDDGHGTGKRATSAAVLVTGTGKPMVEATIPDQTFTIGDAARDIDLSAYFSDSDPLTYAATSSDANVATVSVSQSDSELTITPVGAGAATVEVAATDPGGLSVSQDFTVVVFPTLAAPEIAVGHPRTQIRTEYTLPTSAAFHYEWAALFSTTGFLGTYNVVATARVTGLPVPIHRYDGAEEVGWYRVGLRACTIQAPTICSEFELSIDSLYKPAPPQDLTVTPFPKRMARLSWKAGVASAKYTVQVRKSGEDAWHDLRRDNDGQAHYDIRLDNIVNGEGLAAAQGITYQFRVNQGGTTYLDSSYSDEIALRDSPIIAVNGNSPEEGQDPGKALVLWRTLANVTQYSIRWRKLPSYGNFTHQAVGWQPQSAMTEQDWSGPRVVKVDPQDQAVPQDAVLDETIRGLERGEVYAIQLNYEYEPVPGSGDTRLGFSAREAYVWPSDKSAGVGDPRERKRVATFPLSVDGTNYPNRPSYTYVICEDTFPDISVWRPLIVQALDEWESATNGLFQMVFWHDDDGGKSPMRRLLWHSSTGER